MSDYCVVVTDAARARLFILEEAKVPELESGPKLVECKCLVNPEKKMHEGQVYADLKSGRNRAPQGGSAHGYDDHRDHHEQEVERRFARTVARETCAIFRDNNCRRTVLVAQPRMLGFLRKEFEAHARSGAEIQELAGNLTKLNSAEIQKHLAKGRLLPECRRPGA